eukprot:Skav215316  [mRNA]  locus=scaffold2444:135292:145555:+ [translate_table: standard]
MKVQLFVAALIAGNFVSGSWCPNRAVKECYAVKHGPPRCFYPVKLHPELAQAVTMAEVVDLLHADLFYGFETFFNVMFFFELLVNMYAFWCCRFWKSGWNIFDFVVVAIGILSVLKVNAIVLINVVVAVLLEKMVGRSLWAWRGHGDSQGERRGCGVSQPHKPHTDTCNLAPIDLDPEVYDFTDRPVESDVPPIMSYQRVQMLQTVEPKDGLCP